EQKRKERERLVLHREDDQAFDRAVETCGVAPEELLKDRDSEVRDGVDENHAEQGHASDDVDRVDSRAGWNRRWGVVRGHAGQQLAQPAGLSSSDGPRFAMFTNT